MKQIKLSKTCNVSQVVFGCMRVADRGLMGNSLMRLVEECMDMGVTTFDHAPVYGGYTCEKLFGDGVLRKNPSLRQKMQLVTKTGIVLPGKNGNKTIYYESSKAEIKTEMEASLQNLATDHVDLLLVHRPDVLADPAETGEALDMLVKEGKALHIGVSNFAPSQITMLQSYMQNPIVTNQIELSVKTTTHFFDGTVDDALTRRMPLMAWSPLGGGSVFAGEEEQSVRLRQTLSEIAERYRVSIDTIMYAWLFAHPAQIAAITGTVNISRVRAAAEAQDISLSYDEWYQILEASRGYSVP